MSEHVDEQVEQSAQRALLDKRRESDERLAKRLRNAPNGQRTGLGAVAKCIDAGLSKAPSAMGLCSTCRARIFGDELREGLCSYCARGGYKHEKREHLRARIPAAFHWADLSQPLKSPDGIQVVTEAGRRQAIDWLESNAGLVTIVGSKTGSGKTTLAAAMALAAIDMGHEPAWIRANVLTPDYPNEELALQSFRMAKTRKFVVIDGVGKELGGANRESGILAQRQAWMMDLLNEMHSIDGRRIILTIDLSREAFEEAYGKDAVRRVVTRSSRVHVIALERIAPIKEVAF